MKEYEKLLDKLGMNEERAEELIKEVFKIASEVWDSKKGSIIVDKAAELLSLAKNKEEAYFVGVVATMINNDIAVALNPLSAFTMVYHTIEMLESVKEEADVD